MDFDLSDDQLALRDGARELLDGHASPARVRADVDGDGGIDAELWKAMAEQGWPAVAVAEDADGLGLGTVEVAVLLEEAGRHAAPAPVASTVLALGALVDGGASDLAERLIGGDGIECVAWSRRGDAMRADGDGASWRLRGRSDPVPYAPSASVAVVVAASADGP